MCPARPCDDFLFWLISTSAVRGLCKVWGLEHLQVFIHAFRKQLVVLLFQLVDIPHGVAVVIPDIREDPAFEVGVHHLLFSQQVREPEDCIVHLSLFPVEDRHLQCLIVRGDPHSDKGQLCPQVRVEPDKTGPSHIGSISGRSGLAYDFPQLLLKKVH